MGVAFYKAMKVFSDLRDLRSSIEEVDDDAPAELLPAAEHPAARARVAEDFAKFEALFRAEWAAKGAAPQDDDELEALWRRERGDEEFPTDPFSGNAYGFYADGPSQLVVYSAGPDAETATGDDIDFPIDLGTAPGG
jgi:hypothetical protein